MSKCKVCKQEFVRRSMTHKCCSPECAETYAKNERLKRENKERRAKLEKLKTRRDWLNEAQSAFNAFIRYRDRDLPCISCGRHHLGDNHAGHYRSVGAAPQLRFNEDNVHKQCQPCNVHKSGAILDYRAGLIRKIGEERVAVLESFNEIRRYTIEEAKAIKAEYKEKLKRLKEECGE